MSLNLLVNGLERGGGDSPPALHCRASLVQDRLVGSLVGGLPDLGVIQRRNTRSSVDHQWGLQDGVCWERISVGVLRQDAFLLLSEGEMFMVVLMKCRLTCEVGVCPLFTIFSRRRSVCCQTRLPAAFLERDGLAVLGTSLGASQSWDRMRAVTT